MYLGSTLGGLPYSTVDFKAEAMNFRVVASLQSKWWTKWKPSVSSLHGHGAWGSLESTYKFTGDTYMFATFACHCS